MTSDGGQRPDVDRLARSMLLLRGVHDDEHHHPVAPEGPAGPWSKAPRLPADRAAALEEATRRDRERYLTSGLVPIDCRFCHVTVQVKKLGPTHTSVQWSSEATRRCAHFTEIREAGGDPARVPTCPRLADSIKHAVAEGVLDEVPSAPPPGDG
ncbi:hypothetical protein [Mycolicibacterium thermoresistibile]|jgi:hypothetical protein|uniref:Uncharacterized protein n=2 Tax=Mycolicibacterium thermoresistibile TaxID=1797 RepID=G7CGW2_MYCT3|nr:hypothetical protein [Mycolicibacterium thermoresistibile]EHI12072.1 hypothetical protein KEK_14273 [Mycolicibacterium thermoresistibile ATCC 19527]MCV7188851.1 hypothetical protein [Mycolicibacterium thermoresistibile]GAT14966.1 hypothetical protein RMCT_1936 [Mycolicibacterium thermoresistibile]SNW20188.1 Uncharacterised protein [Mycolicibacterium thermoresistibile]